MLGAEVVKVEPPGGDFGRHAPPLAGSHGAAYLAYNRGKWVEEIDYKHPDGRARLADLAADADVFLHNWRSGRAETLGLTPEKLSARNPGLVYAHASGWGPAADEPCAIAGDFLVQAHGACGDGLNPAGELPVPSRLTILDVTGGLLACEGILAGLYLRERSGCGSRVDTSLFSGAMALQRHVLRAMAAGKEGDRLHGRPVWGPLDQPVETAAGYLVLEVADGATRRRLLKAGGLRDDADDAALLDRLRARSASEWEQILGEVGVPSAAVCGDLASLPADRRTSGLLERVEGDCWMAGAPWRLSP
jgi:crotonobetainyl-CoA:carnitine CoA-transferase CaiB-like acyl-CoA transferase